MGSLIYRVRRYRWETAAHWREAATIRDFLKLMQVRLSQSKAGPLVCRRPVTHAIDLKSFGGPLWLRSHSSDISIINEQLFYPGNDIIVAHTARSNVVIDLGANTGIVTRWLLHHHPNARVVAVEPAEENVEMLTRNLAAYMDRTVVVPHCIGGTPRKVKVATTNGSWAYVMEDVALEDEANSDVVTMSQIIDDNNIDRIGLLKSNIEGAEWEVLEHCADWIDRVDAMVIELHYQPQALEQFRELAGDDWEIVHRVPNPHYECETIAVVRAPA